jgi:hypothetical protein
MIETTIAVLVLGVCCLLLLAWNVSLLSTNRELRMELRKQREWNYRGVKKNQERI